MQKNRLMFINIRGDGMSVTTKDEEQYQKGLKELDKYFNQKWGFPKKRKNKNKKRREKQAMKNKQH